MKIEINIQDFKLRPLVLQFHVIIRCIHRYEDFLSDNSQ